MVFSLFLGGIRMMMGNITKILLYNLYFDKHFFIVMAKLNCDCDKVNKNKIRFQKGQ